MCIVLSGTVIIFFLFICRILVPVLLVIYYMVNKDEYIILFVNFDKLVFLPFRLPGNCYK